MSNSLKVASNLGRKFDKFSTSGTNQAYPKSSNLSYLKSLEYYGCRHNLRSIVREAEIRI